jgi:hypothetical protein
VLKDHSWRLRCHSFSVRALSRLEVDGPPSNFVERPGKSLYFPIQKVQMSGIGNVYRGAGQSRISGDMRET